jgi:hypothetical protein
MKLKVSRRQDTFGQFKKKVLQKNNDMAKGRSRKTTSEGITMSPELFAELTRLASRKPTIVKAARAKRAPSKYNIFMQAEMKRLKESKPAQTITERFREAVANWRVCKGTPGCVSSLPRKLTPRNRRS